jgi:hypothetical protein
MKIVINTCAGRESMLRSLLKELPHAIVNFDDFPKEDAFPFKSTAYLNYLRGMFIAGTGDLLLMEDDIELTSNFLSKVELAKQEYPNQVLQFFSMRNKDLTIGTRIEKGRTYMSCVCSYFPNGIPQRIVEFSKNWYDPKYQFAPNDPMVADFLGQNKLDYVIVVPNLVQHVGKKSMINSKRTSISQSKTYLP